MAKTDLLTVAEINEFAARLGALVQAAHEAVELRALLARFAGTVGASAPKRGPGRPAAAKPATGRTRTRLPGIEPEKVLAALKSQKDGVQIGTLAKAMKERNDRVRTALQKLRAEKKVRMTGERSKALWFPA